MAPIDPQDLSPRPNLFTHQVLQTLQELAADEFQDADGFSRMTDTLNQALVALGVDVSTAKQSEFRKLYHAGFDRVAHTLAQPEDVDLMIERFREFVF